MGKYDELQLSNGMWLILVQLLFNLVTLGIVGAAASTWHHILIQDYELGSWTLNCDTPGNVSLNLGLVSLLPDRPPAKLTIRLPSRCHLSST